MLGISDINLPWTLISYIFFPAIIQAVLLTFKAIFPRSPVRSATDATL